MDPQSLIMLAVVMAIFYFMLVRPQKKRLKEHASLISALKPGDEVVTIGGVYGFINQVDEESVWLEVADGVEMRFTKQAVSKRVDATPDVAEDDSEEETPEQVPEIQVTEPDTTS